MKKFLAIISIMILTCALTACGSSTGEDAGITVKDVDISAYPADINEWTAQNIIDYFSEAVEFPKDCETWVQDHETYYSGLPINECAGCWDEAGNVTIMFFTFSGDNPDTTPEAVESMKQAIIDSPTHTYTEDEDLYLPAFDHMVGNIGFSYNETVDEDVYNAVDSAYNQLIEKMGVTPDF
jgi:predicted small secreted protein